MNKILVVEDEESIAALIRMNLKKAGYQCDLAFSGDEGADLLSENNYDLCLFDIMLHFTGKLFMSVCGTALIWVTAGQLICMYSACAKKPGLKRILKLYIRLVTGLSQGKMDEVILEVIYNNALLCNSGIYGIWKYNYKYPV